MCITLPRKYKFTLSLVFLLNDFHKLPFFNAFFNSFTTSSASTFTANYKTSKCLWQSNECDWKDTPSELFNTSKLLPGIVIPMFAGGETYNKFT